LSSSIAKCFWGLKPSFVVIGFGKLNLWKFGI